MSVDIETRKKLDSLLRQIYAPNILKPYKSLPTIKVTRLVRIRWWFSDLLSRIRHAWRVLLGKEFYNGN